MVTSFSPSGNWWGLNKGILLKNLRWRFDNWFFIRWLCSLPPITVASLTMPEAWCPLMRPSCAHSRWNIRYKNTNIGRLYRGPIIVIVIYNLFLWTNLSRVHNKISIIFQILKPSEKKAKYQYQGINRWCNTIEWCQFCHFQFSRSSAVNVVFFYQADFSICPRIFFTCLSLTKNISDPRLRAAPRTTPGWSGSELIEENTKNEKSGRLQIKGRFWGVRTPFHLLYTVWKCFVTFLMTR